MAAGGVVLSALRVIQRGIRGMKQSLSKMTDRCHPFIFYERVRPFLSGWKGNPTLPDGVLYQGIDVHRREYHGGSAAQSTLFPVLDAALGVSHSHSASEGFLREMRSYMPPGHRRLVEYLYDPARPSVRRFVETYPEHAALPSNSSQAHSPAKADDAIAAPGVHARSLTGAPCQPRIPDRRSTVSGKDSKGIIKDRRDHSEQEMASALKDAYNGCLQALQEFRTTHLGIVSSYIVQQQRRARKARGEDTRGEYAGGKGTGGTPLFEFLKPLRDSVRATLLVPKEHHSPLSSSSTP